MITKFRGMNISSKDPKRLALFYRDVLGVKMLENDPNYDGVTFGNNENEPIFWIWDENNWGKANEGPVCFVFDCDDHNKTYEELKAKGVELDPPITASWGGTELHLKDPDGNKILIL
ncbi:MAG: VOC family protein [Oscillospiraceae bacterium]|nr:VOC family protein [Oscillospiraceae bacterium]